MMGELLAVCGIEGKSIQNGSQGWTNAQYCKLNYFLN